MVNFLVSSINISFAAPGDPEVDDTFNYQGELFDGLNPASGSHDFKVEAWSLPGAGDGIKIGQTGTYLNVPVSNGIFTLENIDLGDITDGFNIYFEIQVRKNAVGAAYEILSPRQKMKSVPYATTLTSGSATLDQVLTYDGSEWLPQDPVVSTTPWAVNGSDISYVAGNVGIGIVVPTSDLHVKSTNAIPVIIDGGANTTTIFSEEGGLRGFIGSGANIAAADFSIGSLGGDMHVVSGGSPRITVTSSGDVGINTTNPVADLTVDGTTGGDLFRVRIDASTKLHVRDNGGTSIGAFKNPPDNGLVVAGNVKQPVSSNGIMKYMASVVNCGNANVSITKSYIAGETVGAGIQPQNDTDGIGSCEVLFPEDIANRYIQATVIGGVAAIGKAVTCSNSGGFITCVVFNTTSGSETPGDIDVLIY